MIRKEIKTPKNNQKLFEGLKLRLIFDNKNLKIVCFEYPLLNLARIPGSRYTAIISNKIIMYYNPNSKKYGYF